MAPDRLLLLCMNESLKVYTCVDLDLWLTYVTCWYHFEVLYDTIHPWHHTQKISNTYNTYNTYFQCYCGSNVSPETANLEHRLTCKVASPSPHVKTVTSRVPKNALKSWISQKLKRVEQKFKNHNTTSPELSKEPGYGTIERHGSVVVSTPAYHAADRGSNPARTRRDY